MGTKLTPGSFDCYAAADDDEPMFVLLARDPDAPDRVEEWAQKRFERLAQSQSFGVEPSRDKVRKTITKIAEALQCAQAMREWRNRKDEQTAAGITTLRELRISYCGPDGTR